MFERGLAVLACVLLGAANARAEGEASAEPASEVLVCEYCGPSPKFPEGRFGLHWHDHWERVGVREAVTIGVSTASAIALSLADPASESRWSGPILFDGATRRGIGFDSRSGRETAATVSDVVLVGSFATPLVIDNVLVTWLARESPDVAWQMAVINAQAYALTLGLTSIVKRVAARERPYVRECRTDPDYASGCGGPRQFESFYSGHAAITATGAGLICAHHTQLELYGNPWLDGGVCLLGIAVTGTTGALRMSSDNHWASDVLMGHLMGYASGYLLPTLLYYREFRVRAEESPHAPTTRTRIAVVPVVSDQAAEIRMMGVF